MILSIKNESKETIVFKLKDSLHQTVGSRQGYGIVISRKSIFEKECIILHKKSCPVRVYRKDYGDNYLIVIEDDSDYLYFP